MASFRYLEFDSTYRDRNMYPNPAEFVVELSSSGKNGRETARDPVSNASPELYWNSSFNELTNEQYISRIIISDINGSGNCVLQISNTVLFPPNFSFRTNKNYYTGCTLKYTNPSNGNISTYRIQEYTQSSSIYAIVKLQPILTVFGNNSTSSFPDQWRIENPTNDTSTVTVPKLFIPSSVSGNNYYNGYYVQRIDTTTNPPTYETRKIIAFDGATHLATLDSNTTTSWNNSNYNFILRKEVPVCTGNILGVDGRAVGLAVNSPTGNFVSNFLRITMPVPVAPNFSTNTAPYGEERKIASYITGDGTFSSIGVSSFTLNTLDNTDFTGCFIRDVTAGITRYISTYNTATKSGTVSAAWGGGLAGDTYSVRTVFLASPFSVAPSVGYSYEVEGFSYDNWNPFTYIGSLVSSQEMVCYEVELINLTLPNRTMVSGRGGYSAFYPYFYVELQNVSAPSSRSNNIIYSNNPHSTKMLFRALVNDTPTPLISPFIKIDGDGMVHTVKFRPNDTFKFAVYHANGELFKTEDADTYSPEAPNPLVQISACFSFKRI